MTWLSRLAERRIAAFRARGGLTGLAGEGRPLPDRPGDAVGFRILAAAGALPPEIVPKKQVAAQRAHLAGLTDPDEIRQALARLADLEMRQAIAEEARRRFLR
ncbi:MAG: DUF1992 domain-containing protein [Rhodobacterales bacterium]|nr:DUF1992 domain-containing protein [Rhodobacterales bacterium]